VSALKLLAEDADDLAVIAAALQDAAAKIGDIAYEPKGRRLTIAFNRFRWEAGKKERVRSGLQLGGVTAVKARNLRQGAKDAVVALLDIAFEPGEAPAGAIVLKFAGDGDLRCEVECIDVALADVSEPWPTRKVPDHPLD
jgi:hypothetical protein